MSEEKFKTRSDDKERKSIHRNVYAKIPNLIPHQERNLHAEEERALLIWRPTEKLRDDEIQEYTSVAKEKYGYTQEQALTMLYWHRYDIEMATKDLDNYYNKVGQKEEFSSEDKEVFELAFELFERDFKKLKTIMPKKPMSAVLKFYYNWKKEENGLYQKWRTAKKGKIVINEIKEERCDEENIDSIWETED